MSASEVLDDLAAQLADDLCLPEFRAGLIVTAITSALCAHAGIRFIPSLLLSVSAGYGAERAYVVVADMHQSAVATLDAYRELRVIPDGVPDAA